ncbi:unnamed protein product, partial [Rotaria magnacalcarata]
MDDINTQGFFFKTQVAEVDCSNSYIRLLDRYKDVCDTNLDHKCELEYLLLRAGFFDLPLVNLFEFKICLNHYESLSSIPRRNNCNICKFVFGERKKARVNGLRHVSKLIAFCLWSDHHVSTYNKTICATCRLQLEKIYNKNDNNMKCEKLFEWLYNPINLFTPDKFHDTYDNSYCQSHAASEEEEIFFTSLKTHGYNGRVEKTESYLRLQHRGQKKFIPDLTRSRFNEAGHQAKVNGYGTIVETGRSPTIRFTNNQVNHFIEYILSPHITSNARRLDSLDPRL